MKQVSGGRRAMLVAFSAWLLAAAAPALAQDPRTSAAQGAALDWLALSDKDDAAGTYAASAKRFKAAITIEKWTEAMKQAREKFGPVQRRTHLMTQTPAPGKNTPPGEFVVLIYRTDFEKRQTGTETITMEREPDGQWRVVGYLMR
jgi:hypothetical protein